MRIRIALYILFSLLNFGYSYAQIDTVDFYKIRNNYYSPKGQIEYSMRILFYDRSNMSQPIDSSIGKYCLAKNMMNIELEGVKTISNENYILSVSENNKSIQLARKDNDINTDQLSFSFIDSMAKASNVKIKKRIVTKELSSFNFIFINEGIDSVVIKYNTRTFLLNTVLIYYNTPATEDYDIIPVIKMIYVNQKVSESVSATKFSIDKYVAIRNTQVDLTPEFKNYTLLNNLRF